MYLVYILHISTFHLISKDTDWRSSARKYWSRDFEKKKAGASFIKLFLDSYLNIDYFQQFAYVWFVKDDDLLLPHSKLHGRLDKISLRPWLIFQLMFFVSQNKVYSTLTSQVSSQRDSMSLYAVKSLFGNDIFWSL